MNLIFFFLTLVPPQQLTWYELYERGEKRFAREEYRLCIEDMDKALALKSEPGRNQFTRAVQKIDYKPYYYKAMSHQRLGNMRDAYLEAQNAFRAPVVRELPLLQSDLTKILENYRLWLTGENQKLEAERQNLEVRDRVTKLAAAGQLEQASQALAPHERQNAEAFSDLRQLIDTQLKFQNEEEELRQNLISSIEQAIDSNAWEAARKLIAVGAGNLTPASKQIWLDQIEKGEAIELEALQNPAPAEPVADPVEETQPENLADALIEENKALIDSYEQRILSLEERERQANQDMQRVALENQQLTQKLADKTDEVPSPPRLVITAQPASGLTVKIEGQVLSDLPVQQWELQLNNSLVEVPTRDWRNDEGGLSLATEVQVPNYGEHQFVLLASDALGRPVRQTRQIILTPPFWLQTWFRNAMTAFLVCLGLGLVGWWWYRRRRAHMRNFNPYIAGSPVRERDMFYGRDQLLARIEGLVHKNCFMIHGERRIGKTSLLLQLKTNLTKSESSTYSFFPVFIDLQGIREEELFHYFMGEILVAASDWPIETNELDFTDDHQNYQSRQFSRDIKRIISRLRETTSKHVVVVLLVDEVDVLNEFGDKTNQKLRGIFMKEYAEFLSCVMAGIHLKKEWESSGSPWYNFFEEIPIDALEEKAARRLILKPVRGIFKYQQDAVAHILRSSGGHPYLIQKICVSLVDQSLREKRFFITKQDVERYLFNLRKESQKKGTT